MFSFYYILKKDNESQSAAEKIFANFALSAMRIFLFNFFYLQLNELIFSSFFITARFWAGIIKQIFTLENHTKEHPPILWVANRKAQRMR